MDAPEIKQEAPPPPALHHQGRAQGEVGHQDQQVRGVETDKFFSLKGGM